MFCSRPADWHVPSSSSSLLQMGNVPLVNENDAVTGGAKGCFGNNDSLAAQLAILLEADMVVYLSDVPALYTADPETDPAAEPIPEIRQWTDLATKCPSLVKSAVTHLSPRETVGHGVPLIWLTTSSSKSSGSFGRGGMLSKAAACWAASQAVGPREGGALVVARRPTRKSIGLGLLSGVHCRNPPCHRARPGAQAGHHRRHGQRRWHCFSPLEARRRV